MANNKNSNTNNLPLLSTLTVEEVLPFNDVIATSTMTSQQVEKKISEFLKPVFTDYEGCKIEPVQIPGQAQPQSYTVKLFFRPCMAKTDGKVYAVKVLGEKDGNAKNVGKTIPLSAMISTINQRFNAKTFELDNIAKDNLAEFLVIPENKAKYEDRYDEETGKTVKIRLPKSWSEYTEEVTDSVGGTGYQNLFFVVRCELSLFIAKLWGKKDPEELNKFTDGRQPRDRYQYSVNIVKVLNPVTKQYILEIRKLDKRELDKLAQSIGYGMVIGNIVMTR